MIPFPGESAPLDWANGLPADGDAVRFRDGSETLTAGSVFVAGFYDHRYLEAGVDAVFSVVVETLAGTSGTLRLSGGPDPDWSLGEVNASAYSLGDHPVTGAQTLVVALPWLTVSDYLAEAVETSVRVEVLSGTVIVQQVKLRIWPPTGAAGGWSAEPYTQPPATANPVATAQDGSGTVNPPEDTSQSGMRALLAALTTGAPGTPDPTKITVGQMTAYDDGVHLNTSAGWGLGYLARPAGSLTGPGFEEDAWVIPPNEVPGDDDYYFQRTGSDSFAWTQATATVILQPSTLDETNAYPVPGAFSVDAEEVVDYVPAGTAFSAVAVATSIAAPEQSTGPLTSPGTEYVDLVVPEFDGPLLKVTIWHPGFYADIAPTGGTAAILTYGQTSDGSTFDRLEYVWTPSPYRWWDPAAAPAPTEAPLRLMQRGDVLGMGSGRVYSTGTRQSSTRVFGSL